MLCPICNNEATIIPKEDGTHYVHCDSCGEDYVPASMMDDNLKILNKSVDIPPTF